MGESIETRVAINERSIEDLKEAIHALKQSNEKIAKSVQTIETQLVQSKGAIVGGLAVLSAVFGFAVFLWDKVFSIFASAGHQPGN